MPCAQEGPHDGPHSRPHAWLDCQGARFRGCTRARTCTLAEGCTQTQMDEHTLTDRLTCIHTPHTECH